MVSLVSSLSDERSSNLKAIFLYNIKFLLFAFIALFFNGGDTVPWRAILTTREGILTTFKIAERFNILGGDFTFTDIVIN